MKASEALKIGRSKVEAGWCKAALVDPEGAVCALGAVWTIGSCTPSAESYLEKALPAGPWFVSDGQHAASVYNDHPKTTKTDILDLFDHAIKLALEDEAEADHA